MSTSQDPWLHHRTFLGVLPICAWISLPCWRSQKSLSQSCQSQQHLHVCPIAAESTQDICSTLVLAVSLTFPSLNPTKSGTANLEIDIFVCKEKCETQNSLSKLDVETAFGFRDITLPSGESQQQDQSLSPQMLTYPVRYRSKQQLIPDNSSRKAYPGKDSCLLEPALNSRAARTGSTVTMPIGIFFKKNL